MTERVVPTVLREIRVTVGVYKPNEVSQRGRGWLASDGWIVSTRRTMRGEWS